MFKRIPILSLLCLAFLPMATLAQVPSSYSSGDILQKMKKLNRLGSVLYIAAHPDDENTRLISYLASQELNRVGYLSLTRGGGGQNLIGEEQAEELAAIRTQELRAAREVDEAEQYFSRALDFGYSKSADETFQFWDKNAVLSDVVWVIRKFRPDVIITRFPTEDYGGHGHHTASALLAEEAYHAAGDPTRFPEQLKYVETWKPQRMFFNASTWWDPDLAERVKKEPRWVEVDVGEFNPLLGQSYTEIAAESRSQHKSQGFGASPTYGSSIEYLRLLKGPELMEGNDLLQGLGTSWARMPGGSNVQVWLDKAVKQFVPQKPEASLPLLLLAYEAMQKLPANPWKEIKLAELEEVLLAVSGVVLDARAEQFLVAAGEPVNLEFFALNRSNAPVRLMEVKYPFRTADTSINQLLMYNQPFASKTVIEVPSQAPVTQPYWLREKMSRGQYKVPNQEEIGLPQNEPAAVAIFILQIGSLVIPYQVPVKHRWTDRVEGAMERPVEVAPPVMVNVGQPIFLFTGSEAQSVAVQVKAAIPDASGKVRLKVPAGWKVSPAQASFELANPMDETTVVFRLTPPAQQSVGELQAVATLDASLGGQEYSRGLRMLQYNHIPVQTLFPPATSRLVKADVETGSAQKIGYIMGAGDKVPLALAQVGYNVALLDDEDLESGNLQEYDAIITGVRAYNTRPRLRYQQEALMEYVKEGGRLIVQYNTNRGLVTDEIGPYPMQLSRDRITNEEAPLEVLNAEHPIFTTPNKITRADFEGWIQERGLYFADEWSEEYQALLKGNDPNEDAVQGALLYTPYGEGEFIYTGLSFFRQLPAGVPGAYRLFSNLIGE